MVDTLRLSAWEKNIKFVHIRPYNFKKKLVNSNFQVEREPVY